MDGKAAPYVEKSHEINHILNTPTAVQIEKADAKISRSPGILRRTLFMFLYGS